MEDANSLVLDLYNQLKMKFDDFYFQDDQVFCLFLVDAQEKRLVDALYHYENSERKTTRSLFLRYSTPFIDREDYLETVLEEFKYIINQSRDEYFVPNEIGLDISVPNQLSSLQELLALSAEFAKNFSTLPDELCVYIDPMAVSDGESWSELLGEYCNGAQNTGVKLFTCFLKTRPNLSTDFMDKNLVWRLEPNLDFRQVSEKISQSGNQSDPQVAFRSAFTRMTLEAQKENWDKAEQAAEQALEVAQSQGWEYLEISIYLSLASFNLSNGLEEKAIEHYTLAISMAKSMSSEDEELKLNMLYQSYMSRAGAYMKMKKFGDARSDYDLSQLSFEGKKSAALQRMEALRMRGYCDFALGFEVEGMEAYMQAVECAKIADAQALPHTTLPIIGSALINEARRRGDGLLVAKTEEDMNMLLGNEWHSLASNMSTI